MSSPDDACIEPPCRLSRSSVWQRQRAYFRRRGLEAWQTATVPHYVSNNPVTARAQAEVAFGYLVDRRDTLGSASPLDLRVVELGAGTGRYAFYFLRALLELCEGAGVTVRVRYVLTDFHDGCFAHFAQHPKLRPFVERGALDFAVFDVETDETLSLALSKETLGPGSVQGSLVVIANYVFDGTPSDAYRVAGGRVFERFVSLRVSDDGEDDDGALSGLDVRFVDGPEVHEGHSAIDALLRTYRDAAIDATVLVPISALRVITALAKLTGGDMLLLSGDKGHTELASLGDGAEPAFVRHGSFSLPVNYHAIVEHTRREGGLALVAESESGRFCTPAFVFGGGGGAWHATRSAFRRTQSSAPAHDVFTLRQGIATGYETLEIEHLISVLRLSQDDPRVLTDLAPIFSARATMLSARQRRELSRCARRAWESYFDIGERTDVPFVLASLHHALGDLDDALALFRESLRTRGDDARTHFNIGACLLALGRHDDAAAAFAEARRGGVELTLLAK